MEEVLVEKVLLLVVTTCLVSWRGAPLEKTSVSPCLPYLRVSAQRATLNATTHPLSHFSTHLLPLFYTLYTFYTAIHHFST